MEIIRGTTPTISVTLEDGVKFSDLGNVKLRIKQGTFSIDKEPTIVDDVGIFTYTQEETLKLYEGTAMLQLIGVNGTTNEVVYKTGTYEIIVLRSLWNEAVHNE